MEINIGIQIFLQDTDFTVFGYIHISKIAGSYGSSTFNFLMNLHTVSIVAASFYVLTNSIKGLRGVQPAAPGPHTAQDGCECGPIQNHEFT